MALQPDTGQAPEPENEKAPGAGTPEAEAANQRGPDWTALDIVAMARKTPPPIDYVLYGLEVGTVSILAASGGSYKSTLALQTVLQLAMPGAMQGSWKWSTFPPRRDAQGVVFASLEDSPTVIWHRLHPLLAEMSDTTLALIKPYLQVVDMRRDHLDVRSGKWLADLERLSTGKRLVVIDTWRRATSGDVNSDADMGPAIDALEVLAARTKCAYLILHHVAKAAVLNGQALTQQAIKGSAVLVDNPRWAGTMQIMGEADAKANGISADERKSYVQFGLVKANSAALYAQWYRRLPEGLVQVELDTVKRAKEAAAAAEAGGGFDFE